MRLYSGLKVLMMMTLATVVAGCAPKVSTRGHVDMQEKVEQIVAGQSHKQDVMALLG